jgi:hypothetical protein
MKPNFWPMMVLILSENSNLFLGATELLAKELDFASDMEGTKAIPAAVPDALISVRRLICFIIYIGLLQIKYK